MVLKKPYQLYVRNISMSSAAKVQLGLGLY